jgi:hypothetical protein
MGAWLAELGVSPAPVLPLAIPDVLRGAGVAGPVPDLAEQVRPAARCGSVAACYPLTARMRSGS